MRIVRFKLLTHRLNSICGGKNLMMMLNEIKTAFKVARYEHDYDSPHYGYVWKSFYEYSNACDLSQEAESLCLKAFNDSRIYDSKWGYKFADWGEYLQHLKSVMQIKYADSKF